LILTLALACSTASQIRTAFVITPLAIKNDSALPRT